MNVAAGPELAAAVTNAGGLGVIGGVGYTPKVLRSQVPFPALFPIPTTRLTLISVFRHGGYRYMRSRKS